jgi:hypothetical protein
VTDTREKWGISHFAAVNFWRAQADQFADQLRGQRFGQRGEDLGGLGLEVGRVCLLE